MHQFTWQIRCTLHNLALFVCESIVVNEVAAMTSTAKRIQCLHLQKWIQYFPLNFVTKNSKFTFFHAQRCGRFVIATVHFELPDQRFKYERLLSTLFHFKAFNLIFYVHSIEYRRNCECDVLNMHINERRKKQIQSKTKKMVKKLVTISSPLAFVYSSLNNSTISIAIICNSECERCK